MDTPEPRRPLLPRIRAPRRTAAVVTAAPAPPRVTELEANGLTWIQLDAPTLDEATALAERFGWHPLDVEDILSRRPRPKVDDYQGNYLFIVLHFPFYDPRVGRLAAGELDILLGQDYLATLPAVELRPLTRLFQRCDEDEAFRTSLFSKGSARLLYEVLDDLFDYCFPVTDKIGLKLDSIEEDMLEGLSKQVALDISNVKQEIISYRKLIKPERAVLPLLEKQVERFLPEKPAFRFSDITDAAELIWDLLDNYKEVAEALEDTSESLLNHRLNDVLRVLTLFTAVLLPLTLIASLAALEFRNNLFSPVGGVYFILAVMMLIVVGMVTFFKKKDWL